MLRSICSQVFTKNSSALLGARLYATNGFARYREINNVTLIGTLISDSYTLPSGDKQLTVRTEENNDRTTHSVRLKFPRELSSGQRVHISGKLNSFKGTSNGKTITQTIVYANQLNIVEGSTSDSNDENSSNGDKNNVQICATIASDILNKDNHSVFNLATHYNFKDSEESKTDFHSVFVYDKPVMDFVKKNLGKSDRILIEGKIGHYTFTGDDGKRKYSGFIVASNIYKLGRQRTNNESVAAQSEPASKPEVAATASATSE